MIDKTKKKKKKDSNKFLGVRKIEAEPWSLEKYDQTQSLTSRARRRQKGCRLQSDMPRGCASGMEGHEATGRQSFSEEMPGACLPKQLLRSRRAGAEPAESAEAHLTREAIHTNADRCGQKGVIICSRRDAGGSCRDAVLGHLVPILCLSNLSPTIVRCKHLITYD